MSDLAVDRTGRLVYAYGPSGASISRDAGATFRPAGRFLGTTAVDAPPELIAAGDRVLGSLPGAGLPTIVEQTPHPGKIVAAPDGRRGRGIRPVDYRHPIGRWHMAQ